MPMGNCQNLKETVALLLKNGDFNARITVAQNARATTDLVQKSTIDDIWREYIRDSMGHILGNNNEYIVDCLVVSNGQSKPHSIGLYGKDILAHYWEIIKECDGFRFTLTQANCSKLTWIFVR